MDVAAHRQVMPARREVLAIVSMSMPWARMSRITCRIGALLGIGLLLLASRG